MPFRPNGVDVGIHKLLYHIYKPIATHDRPFRENIQKALREMSVFSQHSSLAPIRCFVIPKTISVQNRNILHKFYTFCVDILSGMCYTETGQLCADDPDFGTMQNGTMT